MRALCIIAMTRLRNYDMGTIRTFFKTIMAPIKEDHELDQRLIFVAFIEGREYIFEMGGVDEASDAAACIVNLDEI